MTRPADAAGGPLLAPWSASASTLPDTDLVRGLPAPYFSELVASVRVAQARTDGGVVDLARGNPDIPPPAHVPEALRAAALEPGVHGYPPFAGLPELAEAFVAHQRAVFGVELDPQREVVAVPGTKTAIALVCMALAGRGDAVLMPDPGYPDYPSGIALAGADLVPLPLDPAANFAPDWSAVAPADLRRARMAFLNYPSNPCGTCASPELFAEAVDVARATRTPIVHDLAYGELVYDGNAPLSFLATPGAKEVGVELVSMSKTYGMAGWRVGFVCGNADIVARVRLLLDHMTVGIFVPVQRGAIAALSGPQDSVEALRRTYEARSHRVAAALDIAPAQGSYYLWWRLPDGVTCERLLEEAHVALAPGWGFGARAAGWARISVATPDAVLDEGVRRIATFLRG